MLDMTWVELKPTPAQSRFTHSAELRVHEYSPTEATLFKGNLCQLLERFTLGISGLTCADDCLV